MESGAWVHSLKLDRGQPRKRKISPHIGVVSQQGPHDSLVSQFAYLSSSRTDFLPCELQVLATAALDGSVFLLDSTLGHAEKPEGSMVSKDVPKIEVDAGSPESQHDASGRE